MKNNPIVTGFIAFFSPIPMVIFTIIWSWVWFFGIGIGLLNYDTVPQWMLVVTLLPLFISPILGVLGIIHSMVKIKTKRQEHITKFMKMKIKMKMILCEE